MTTRQSLQDFVDKATIVMAQADYQVSHSLQVGKYHEDDYLKAQTDLQSCLGDLEALYNSGNAQQKEELTRLRSQLISLQQQMVVAPH